uniref:CRAL-TRIO domain-containing protein n=1 Tax=Strigamia maritima TaxID=126957 RepID=T1JKW3_STRMM
MTRVRAMTHVKAASPSKTALKPPPRLSLTLFSSRLPGSNLNSTRCVVVLAATHTVLKARKASIPRITKAAVGTKFASHHGWPLCYQNRLLVHLGEADSSLVKHGDFYLCVRATHAAAGVQLVLKYRTRCSGIKEKVIANQEFANIFTMDWFHSLELDSASDEQWATQLQNMLVGVEKGIDRIRCDIVFRPTVCNHAVQTDDIDESDESPQRHHSTEEDTSTPTNNTKDEILNSSKTNVRCDVCHRHSTEIPKSLGTLGPLSEAGKRDSSVQTSPMDECKTFSLEYSDKDNSCLHSLDNENKKMQDIYQNKGEFKPTVKKRVTEDQDDGYHDICITTPNGINELDPAILHSKVALLPGCRDNVGRAIVTVDCELLRSFPQFTSAQFAQLFLYFHSTLRKEVASKGLFVLVDISKTSQPNMLAFLDEIFCMIEGHTPGIIQILVLWSGECNADKWTKETQHFPQSSIQFELVTNQDRLFKLINQENLLPHYGGTYHFHLEEWHEFRKIFEPFVHECRSSGKRLVNIMQGLKGSRLPPTSELTSQIIDEHKQLVVSTFDDPQLKRLQADGKETLKDLQSRLKQTPHNLDLMDSVVRGEALYNELQRAVVKLSRLSERRLFKFEQVLQMRVFEEDTGQVLSWLCKKGEETLDRFKTIAENLAAVRVQERDFEKFYFVAMHA